MLIAALFIRAKKWTPQYLPTDKWLNKMWFIHTMEYSAMKKKSTEPCYNKDEL